MLWRWLGGLQTCFTQALTLVSCLDMLRVRNSSKAIGLWYPLGFGGGAVRPVAAGVRGTPGVPLRATTYTGGTDGLFSAKQKISNQLHYYWVFYAFSDVPCIKLNG